MRQQELSKREIILISTTDQNWSNCADLFSPGYESGGSYTVICQKTVTSLSRGQRNLSFRVNKVEKKKKAIQ